MAAIYNRTERINWLDPRLFVNDYYGAFRANVNAYAAGLSHAQAAQGKGQNKGLQDDTTYKNVDVMKTGTDGGSGFNESGVNDAGGGMSPAMNRQVVNPDTTARSQYAGNFNSYSPVGSESFTAKGSVA